MTDIRSCEAQPGPGALDAWVPVGLLDFEHPTSLPVIQKQGLTPVRLAWHQGRLCEPKPLPAEQAPPSRMVLPRLVDCHVHLDKAYTWQDHPNLSGSYGGALEANLQEHNSRTVASVLQRGERAMARAFDNGLRPRAAMSTVVAPAPSPAGKPSSPFSSAGAAASIFSWWHWCPWRSGGQRKRMFWRVASPPAVVASVVS